MSGKHYKIKRKEKRMAAQQTQNEQKFSMEYLEKYITLHSILTGEKPTEITVVPQIYNWYTQEVMKHADNLGLKRELKSDPEFLGVKIVEKVRIEK